MNNLSDWDHYGGIMTSGVDISSYINDAVRMKLNPLKLKDFMNPGIYTTENKHYLEEQRVNIDMVDFLRKNSEPGMFNEKNLLKMVKMYPKALPNLTYKLTMQERFGQHKAAANNKLGYLPW